MPGGAEDEAAVGDQEEGAGVAQGAAEACRVHQAEAGEVTRDLPEVEGVIHVLRVAAEAVIPDLPVAAVDHARLADRLHDLHNYPPVEDLVPTVGAFPLRRHNVLLAATALLRAAAHHNFPRQTVPMQEIVLRNNRLVPAEQIVRGE